MDRSLRGGTSSVTGLEHQVQLEQSDMRLALNVAKMAIQDCLGTAIEETQCLIIKPRVQVREDKKRGAGFPGHKKVKAAMKRHPDMFCRKQLA
jgi:hypothetical protein